MCLATMASRKKRLIWFEGKSDFDPTAECKFPILSQKHHLPLSDGDRGVHRRDKKTQKAAIWKNVQAVIFWFRNTSVFDPQLAFV